jgi:hypothetical protein
MIAPAKNHCEADILEEAEKALADQLFYLRRHLTCEYRDGLLLLRGRVASYYQKQVAQEAVLRLDAVHRVVNHIEVVSV